MATHVILEIVPQRIDAEDWAEVYDETLRLLRAHPSGLMGLDARIVEGVSVAMYTRELERDREDPARRSWCVTGDRQSLRGAEDQVMYRDLDHYRRGAAGEAAVDVLLASDQLRWEWTGGPLPRCATPALVLGKKTQGEPYHLPVLTAAMVVETRFPLHAMVSGEITAGQAEQARRWAEEVLGHRVSLPVRVQPERLLARLREHLGGRDLATALDRLYVEVEPTRKVEAILGVLPAAEGEEWLVARMAEEGRPGTVEAMRLAVGWLNATADLARLCELACLDDRGPRFPRDRFVEALAGTWIAVPRASTEHLEALALPSDEPPRLLHLVGTLAMDFGGALGRHLGVRLDEGQLEAALARAFGQEAPRLVALVRERTAHIVAELDELRPALEELLAGPPEQTSDVLEGLRAVSSPEQLGTVQRLALLGIALGARKVRARMESERPGLGAAFAADVQGARRRLVQVLAQRGPRLSEDAWDWIREEEDPQLLLFLTVVTSMPGAMEDYERIRRAVLESRELCRFAEAASRDEARTSEVLAFLDRHVKPPAVDE